MTANGRKSIYRAARPRWQRGDTGRFNAALARRIADDGYLMLSTTVLRGRTVLRMCTINPRTTDEEIAGVVERMAALAANLAGE